MADEIAIKVDNVSKTFKLPHEKTSTLKSTVINFYKRDKGFEKQEALKDISFEVKKGEFFGIVGRNGSGKSTLLKLLAGIYSADSGGIQINGKLTPFIELGVGFSPELSGRDNVFLNGALLGFNRKEMDAMYDDIVEFSELARFMDQKLKNYSSGMQVRLAFSIAIQADSDILLLDEVLAVGDAAFQTKCFDYFYKLKKQKKTVILVSHDRSAIERFCERGILINDGEIIAAGKMNDVMREYSSVVLGELNAAGARNAEENSEENQPASDYALIQNIVTSNQEGEKKSTFTFSEKIHVEFEVLVKRPIENPILGVTLWRSNLDKPVFASNTMIEGSHSTGNFSKGDKIVCQITLPDYLNDGEYFVEPAIANESGSVVYDSKPKGHKFYIAGSENPYSLISTKERILIKRK